MAGGGFLRRLLRRSNIPPISFEADWSAISAAGLSEVFKELLADLAGIPTDLKKQKHSRFGWHFWNRADIEDIYSQKHFAAGAENGFLVRGVIYDMSALIQSSNLSSISKTASADRKNDVDSSKARDWTSLIDENLNLRSSVEVGKLDSVDANEVMEKLGLKGVAGIQERVGRSKHQMNSRQHRLETKQALEEIIGTGDSIRVKYSDRLRQKKMVAEARREQEKLGMTPAAAPRSMGSGTGLLAMPGSPALVRYLEERGLNQALLAHGVEGDLETLLDQIGNYQFQVVKRVPRADKSSVNGEVLSKELLKKICADWSLPPKQVMVVAGPGTEGERILKLVKDSQFFVCQVDNKIKKAVDTEEQGTFALLSSKDVPGRHSNGDANREHREPAQEHMSISKTLSEKTRIFRWLKKLSEGTLHVDDQNVILSRGNEVNFSVQDMVELKWVIEDLNGVSYRRSTMVRGFEGVVTST